jgi:hypothetical protein
MWRKLTEFLRPKQRPPRTCEACGQSFQCGASLTGCWCMHIKLSPEVKQKLRAQYQDCLCPQCLQEAAYNIQK